ncbi:MAG: 23S rRNA (adenine(2503)-C(2))-methyltransferase RlmN [Armatimonadetes bacterium]|nr:23S rRNA (adenine(2503)-C(2))-methyltransferase RlmN [Armatimonadota bacterium]
MPNTKHVLGLATSELVTLCEELGYPAYRGKQLANWLYRKGAREIDSMSNLPRDLREKLKGVAALTRSRVLRESRSEDGTTKFLLELADGETIESVLLPYGDRVSVCVSTQVGCPAGCVFCATAECGFVRNLTAGEIVDQVLTLRQSIPEPEEKNAKQEPQDPKTHKRVTHVVFMGMGEPLLNLQNVLKAVRILNEEVGISMRRMTISTVGITPAIRKLAELDLQLTLAISLHAPDDNLRRKLIPLSSKYPLEGLIAACRDYANRTKRRITFEYLLLAGVNDSPAQAATLARLIKGMLCHVNLIPYNRVIGKSFSRPSDFTIREFRSTLERFGIEVTQRLERGHAISAACGQLKRGTPASGTIDEN